MRFGFYGVLVLILFGGPSSLWAATVTFKNTTDAPIRIDDFRKHNAEPLISPEKPVTLEAGASYTVAKLDRGIYHVTVCGGGWCSQTSMAVHDEKTDYIVQVFFEGQFISSRAVPNHWDEYFGTPLSLSRDFKRLRKTLGAVPNNILLHY